MNVTGPLLQEILQEAGYRTGAVTCNPFLTGAFGFDAGFDVIDPVTQHADEGMNMRRFFSDYKHFPTWRRYLTFIKKALGSNFVADFQNALQFRFGMFQDEDDGAQQATRRVVDFFDKADGNPFFCYIYYTETHMNSGDETPYSLPEDAAFRFLDPETDLSSIGSQTKQVDYDEVTQEIHERLYDGAIRYLDDRIAELIDALKQRDQWNDTVLVLTADHGELLGEHGRIGHGCLYEPAVNVPLLIRLPDGDSHRGTTIEKRVNTVSLYRTLLEYVGQSVRSDAAGGNLLTDRPETVLIQDYSSGWDWSRYETDEQGGTDALYHNEKKLITGNNRTELFDLETDPRERENLSNKIPGTVDTLRTTLREKVKQRRTTSAEVSGSLEVDAQTEDRLADLGYIDNE
jgi:arylsulfatase A-like enzyme